jgi:predicted transglutaminase-like cysteine proteinase
MVPQGKTLLSFITILLSGTIFLSDVKFAHAEKHTDVLPPAIHYSASIGNLPKWERIINFYEMANLTTPSSEYKNWWNVILSLRNDHPADQISKVNKWANKFPYKQDNWIYGRDDHWATPSEFLKNGGDCEDYAIIKYMTLRRLGLRADQMKITMVYDIYSGTDHAYLVVKYGGQSFILDSREDSTDPAIFKKRYKPHYAFNEKGIWTFKSPKIVIKARQGNEVLPSNR